MPVVIQRPESDLERKFKAAAVRLLEVAERDPERFIQGVERMAEWSEQAYRFFQERPESAKRVTRNAALAVIAKLARKKLTGG